MRYKDVGELHKDFHLATNRTIQYVLEKYGEAFLRELFRRTAQLVYKDIYEGLQKGDASGLLAHWEYYYQREGGDFFVAKTGDGFVFHVTVCPAAVHLREKEGTVPKSFHLQSILLNDGWSDGTPFTIETEILGDTEYRMTVRRNDAS